MLPIADESKDEGKRREEDPEESEEDDDKGGRFGRSRRRERRRRRQSVKLCLWGDVPKLGRTDGDDRNEDLIAPPVPQGLEHPSIF